MIKLKGPYSIDKRISKIATWSAWCARSRESRSFVSSPDTFRPLRWRKTEKCIKTNVIHDVHVSPALINDFTQIAKWISHFNNSNFSANPKFQKKYDHKFDKMDDRWKKSQLCTWIPQMIEKDWDWRFFYLKCSDHFLHQKVRPGFVALVVRTFADGFP